MKKVECYIDGVKFYKDVLRMASNRCLTLNEMKELIKESFKGRDIEFKIAKSCKGDK